MSSNPPNFFRDRAVRASMHADPWPSAESAAHGARVVRIPARPPLPEPDAADRALVAAVMDPQNRIALTKLAPVLGWEADAPLVLSIDAGKVRVRPGSPHEPDQLASCYRSGRITLPVTVRAVLDLAPGDAVVASTSADGSLLLHAAAAVARLLDDVTATQDVAPPAAKPRPARRSGVAPAWHGRVATSA